MAKGRRHKGRGRTSSPDADTKIFVDKDGETHDEPRSPSASATSYDNEPSWVDRAKKILPKKKLSSINTWINDDGQREVAQQEWRGAFKQEFHLNQRELDRELRPHERGAADGARPKNPYPAPDASDDDFHRELRNRASELMVEKSGKRMAILRQMEKELAVELPDPVPKLENILNRALKIDMPAIYDRLPDTITRAKRAASEALRDYRLFQTNHARTEEPKRSRPMVLILTIMAVIILVEAIVNSFIFADVIRGGTPMAIVLAGFVAILNVVISSLAGRTFGRGLTLFTPGPWNKTAWARLDRSILWSNWVQKILSLFGVLFFFVGIAIFHFLVGSYRTIIAETRSLTDAGLFNSIQNRGLMLWTSDNASMLLVVIGGLISIYAFYEGMTMQDSYPGYARKRDYLDEQQALLHAAKKDLRKNGVFDQAKRDIDGVVATYERQIDKFHRNMREFQALAQAHFEEVERSEEIINAIATAYRDSNTHHRAGVPVPGYFHDRITIDHSISPLGESPEERFIELQNDLEDVKKIATEYLEKLREKESIAQARLDEEIAELEGKVSDSLKANAPILNDGQANDHMY